MLSMQELYSSYTIVNRIVYFLCNVKVGDRKIFLKGMTVKTQAEHLMQARSAAGYAMPTDAARAFGWNWPTYYSHENGNRGLTSKTAARYGKAFRVSPAWLLIGEGIPEMTPTEQPPRFQRDLLAVAIASLSQALVQDMDQEQADALAEAVLKLVELRQRRKRTENDLDNLSKAVSAVAKLAGPQESE
jgi:hypothetical protein